MPSATPKESYLDCIKHTQLISVDLVIESQGKVLTGFRSNAPARGTFFVPGGRVFKGESIPEAIRRVSLDEVGVPLLPADGESMGVWNHVYPDNFDNEDFGTEYVVFAYRFNADNLDEERKIAILGGSKVCHKNKKEDKKEDKYQNQHEEIRFISINDILNNRDVHEFVRNYYKTPQQVANRIL